jgi:hypothetical protein
VSVAGHVGDKLKLWDLRTAQCIHSYAGDYVSSFAAGSQAIYLCDRNGIQSIDLSSPTFERKRIATNVTALKPTSLYSRFQPAVVPRRAVQSIACDGDTSDRDIVVAPCYNATSVGIFEWNSSKSGLDDDEHRMLHDPIVTLKAIAPRSMQRTTICDDGTLIGWTSGDVSMIELGRIAPKTSL